MLVASVQVQFTTMAGVEYWRIERVEGDSAYSGVWWLGDRGNLSFCKFQKGVPCTSVQRAAVGAGGVQGGNGLL